MNRFLSAKGLKTLLLVLCAVLCVLGVGVLSYARTGAMHASAAVNSNFAKAYMIEYSSEWNGSSWGEISQKQDREIVDGDYAILDKPSVKKLKYKENEGVRVFEDASNYEQAQGTETNAFFLKWYSVRFTLGNANNRLTTLTQSATLKGIRLSVNDKTSHPETNNTSYYETWEQNFFAVKQNWVDFNDESASEPNLETATQELLNNYLMKYSNNSVVSDLDGQYAISYVYVPENQNDVSETFSFFMITSDAYDTSRIVVGNAEDASNTNEQTIKNYNKKKIFRFNSNNQTNHEIMEYPTYSFDPESFVVNYKLTQYNLEENVTLNFSKIAYVSETNQTAQLEVTKTFNNGAAPETIIYTAKVFGTGENDVEYRVNGELATGQDNVLFFVNQVTQKFEIKLTFYTPGLYEFTKNIRLKTNDSTYVTPSQNKVKTIHQNEIFNDDALWMFGYNATYTNDGVNQKPLFNNSFNNKIYVSDFTYLMGQQYSISGTQKQVQYDGSNINGNVITTNLFDFYNNQNELDNEKIAKTQNTLKGYAEQIGTNAINSNIKATTNQAPVIFSSEFYLPNYNSKIEGYYYNATAPLAEAFGRVDKTTRFTKIGEYYVLLRTENTPLIETEGNEKVYVYQLFAFNITSSSVKPTIFKDTATAEGKPYYDATAGADATMSVDEFTKENVYLSWTANSPFEHKVTVEIAYNENFSTEVNPDDYELFVNATKGRSLVTIENTTYTSLLTQPGFYKFRITSNKNTVSYYSFVIDKTPISGFNAYTYDPDGKTVSIANIPVNGGIAITNSSFVWSWNLKASGAPITAKRYFAPMVLQSEYTNKLFDDAISVNAQIQKFNSTALKYTRFNFQGNVLPTSSQIIDSAGLYVLVLTDAAGNEAVFATFLDNTKPTIYVTKENSVEEITGTTLNETTNVYWRQNKAIMFADDFENIFDGTTLPSFTPEYITTHLNIYESHGYLTIANSSVNLVYGTTSSKAITLPEQCDSVQIEVNIDADNNGTATLKNLRTGNKIANTDVLSLDFDAIYTFTVNDSVSNANKKNLRISLDQSGVKMLTFDTETTISSFTNDGKAEVYDGFGTNRKIAVVRWQNPENEQIHVDSIVVEYYPYLSNLSEYDGDNYPYVQNPTFTYTIYDKNDSSTSANYYSNTIDTGLEFVSKSFNTESADAVNLTKPGKYVVIRTFTNDSDLDGTGMNQVRRYSYYVDRNKIISEEYANYSITYGYDAQLYNTNKYPNYDKATTEIGQISNNADLDFGERTDAWNNIVSAVDGNRLDVFFNTPDNFLGYKYSLLNQDLELNQAFNIIICIQRCVVVGNEKQIETNYYKYFRDSSLAQNSGYKDIKTLQYTYPFNVPATYRVMIYDWTNNNSFITENPRNDIADFVDLQNNKTSPNFTVFYFEITDDAPAGQFQAKSSAASNYNAVTSVMKQSGTDITTYYTNDDYVVFTFNDSSLKAFDAKIAYKDVKVVSTYEKFGEIVKVDNITLNFVETQRFSPTATYSNTEPALYYTEESGTKTYYVVLPKIVNNAKYNSQLNCTYAITLSYIETENKHEWQNKNYASSTSYIYIDHTAPYKNLVELITNDKYLNEIEKYYPNTINYITTHLDDENFDFLNHYVFTVTEDFYLKYYGASEGNFGRYKTYATNTYNGTTATQITNNYYPEFANTVDHYTQDIVGGVPSGASNLIPAINDSKYRPFKAGNYYDVIEADNAGNYRVYTIYVTGTSTKQDEESIEADRLFAATSNLYGVLNIDNSKTNKTTKKYFGINGSNASEIEISSTLNQKSYEKIRFFDLFTSANKTTTAGESEEEIITNVSVKEDIYWLIVNYSVETENGTTNKTILYFPADNINNGRESSKQIKNLKEMLNLGNNAAVTFINSKEDLLDTLNSLLEDASNQAKMGTRLGAKVKFEFVNKVNGRPYYAVENNLIENEFGDLVPEVIGSRIVLKNKTNVNIAEKYDSTFNYKGDDIVKSVAAFIKSTTRTTFVLQIPASNISTYITQIYLNDNASLSEENRTRLINSEGELITSTFSMNQSYKFTFEDNFEDTITWAYPVDSEYLQEFRFADGSKKISNVDYTCGETSFVYDSNHLGYKQIIITNLLTQEVVYDSTKDEEKESSAGETPDESGEGEQPDQTKPKDTDFFLTTVGNNGTTTLSFFALKNVYYEINVKVGSTSDNLTSHVFVLYTIFPIVTITDKNEVNMLPKDSSEQLITSKDLFIGLVPNINAMFNPKVYLTNGTSVIELGTSYKTAVTTNGVYTITFENDIGKFSAGTIKFTRKTYDISIYGVYYNDNNNYNPLVKRVQGYNTENVVLEPEGTEGEQTTPTLPKNIDRYFFLSSSENDWNNVIILLNENKQLQLKIKDGKNYIYYDEENSTRIYHVFGTSPYNLNAYFAITRIPSSTDDLVPDFRINNKKPSTSLQAENTTQIYPVMPGDDLTAQLTWTPNKIQIGNNVVTIEDFYVLDLWLNGTFVGSYTSGDLTLKDSGAYTIQIHDILGQYKTFAKGSKTYRIEIYKDVVFSINDNNPIQNATFNDKVKLTINNFAQYNASNFSFKVLRNSADFDAELVNGTYTFTTPGVYYVSMSGTLEGKGNNVEKLVSEYRFTIISSNEARLNYEFAKRSGYTITKIVKDGEELTTDKDGEPTKITPLYSLWLDASDSGMFGVGKYEITVSVKGEGLIPTMEYTYTIWINNETAILNTTRDWGTSSIAPFTLKLNPSIVFTRIGNCYVTVTHNGKTTTAFTINEENSAQNEEISKAYTAAGVYVIQMYSESGNLLSSQRITINEPLNTVAIVLIVLSVVVVVSLIIMFVVIRKRQKVK